MNSGFSSSSAHSGEVLWFALSVPYHAAAAAGSLMRSSSSVPVCMRRHPRSRERRISRHASPSVTTTEIADDSRFQFAASLVRRLRPSRVSEWNFARRLFSVAFHSDRIHPSCSSLCRAG